MPGGSDGAPLRICSEPNWKYHAQGETKSARERFHRPKHNSKSKSKGAKEEAGDEIEKQCVAADLGEREWGAGEWPEEGEGEVMIGEKLAIKVG